jgi:hypothetical protein
MSYGFRYEKVWLSGCTDGIHRLNDINGKQVKLPYYIMCREIWQPDNICIIPGSFDTSYIILRTETIIHFGNRLHVATNHAAHTAGRRTVKPRNGKNTS